MSNDATIRKIANLQTMPKLLWVSTGHNVRDAFGYHPMREVASPNRYPILPLDSVI
jgi:hypothetical protein